MFITRYSRYLPLILVLLFLASCGNAAINQRGVVMHEPHPDKQPDQQSDGIPTKATVLDLRQAMGLEQLIPILVNRPVVYVGESHDNYAHHQAQLAVIDALHESGADLAIGMEMFQQPFQQYLDDYVAGRITEAEMLKKTEWYDRWVYDYRLYQPILEYAKSKSIPVIALNVPREVTRRVSEVGLDGLNEEERSQVPVEIDNSDQAYRERLKKIFNQHGKEISSDFERFLQVQLVWDEGMAARAADYLQAHPDKQMVVLAGSGHLMHRSGIPNRVQRRHPVSSAVVLPGGNLRVVPGVADFMLFPEQAELPPAAVLGIYMEQAESGVLVSKVVKQSAADLGGVEPDDIILAFDGEQVTSPNDLRIQLLRKKPGDEAELTLLRRRVLLGEKQLDVKLILGQ